MDYAMVDFAVNSGPSRAIKFLQRILLVRQDGIIRPQTLAARARAKVGREPGGFTSALMIWS